MFVVAAVALADVSAASTVTAVLTLFAITTLTLGTGNGAVVLLVPQRFATEIGATTGLVGMAGRIGGFDLASSPDIAK